MDATVTEDKLLDGRVRLLQPAAGYRTAIDPVFLAAALPARAGSRVLDAGSGVGAASLCLAARARECSVVGVEAQPELLELARRNIALNGMSGRVEAVGGGIESPPGLEPASFDFAMTNPPYHAAGTPSPDPGKAVANMEGALDLGGWLRACLALLKPKGVLLAIHRADRLADLLAALEGRAGAIAIFPLWPKPGRPAKRILLRARKGSDAPLTLLPGLILHREDGAYTDAAEAVLRGGHALDWPAA